MCPTPLVGDTSSCRGFVLAPLEEHPSEAQGKLVPLLNLSMSGASFREAIAHPRFFSVPLSQCTGFVLVPRFSCGGRSSWQPGEEVWHENVHHFILPGATYFTFSRKRGQSLG